MQKTAVDLVRGGLVELGGGESADEGEGGSKDQRDDRYGDLHC